MIDDDVRQAIVRELEPGEHLLWSGRPGGGIRFRGVDAFLIPFSILWAGFAVFWEYMALRLGAPLLFPVWGIPFVLVGLYMVAGRFFVDARRRRNTAYGVTDRRVIVLSGLTSRSTTSHALKVLPAITLSERRNGEGDILLTGTDMNRVAAAAFLWRGSVAPPALEFVANARQVYEIVREAQRQAV